MPTLQRVPVSDFHPGYGCAIMVIAILFFGGLVSFGIYAGLKQDKEFASFSADEAPPLRGSKISDAIKESLKTKLAQFSGAAAKGEAARLSLSVADCNGLLALAPDFGIGDDQDSSPYFEIMRFTGMNAERRVLQADLRYPMRKLTWHNVKKFLFSGTSGNWDHRYLVGSSTFKPVIEDGSLAIHTDAIIVPGKTVSEGFVDSMRHSDWLDLAKKRNALFAETLKKITAWRVADDGSALILECSKPAPAHVKP